MVRAAATQNPVARARVTLASDAFNVPRVAITGPDGRYTFERLPAGSYTVHASASGYAAQYHRQRPTGAPASVRISDAQRVAQIDVDLPAAGVIVGRLLDEDQRPFVGASVDALVSRIDNQQPTLVSMAKAVTDDRGEFRLAGLPAGEYYVSAFDPAFAEAGDDTGPLRYTATYYPGVVVLEEARPVSVAPGSEPKAPLVFALKIVRPARVRGIIATEDRRQLLSGAVVMAPVRGEGLSAVASDDVRIEPDGRFAFRNVAPGRYQIFARAQTEPQGVALFATYRLLIDGRDLENVELSLRPGAIVRGAVAFEARQARAPRGFAGLRVRTPFPDGSLFGDAHTGDVATDGRFSIRGVMAGRHYVRVEGLQHPWVLKEVRWRGEDVTDRAIDVDAKGVIDDVRITLTDIANDVSGTVRDGRGRPVHEALVLIVAVAPQLWARASRRLAVVRTDSDGRYQVRGLPAGEYRVLASIELDESHAYRGEVLRALSEQGQPLTLGAPQAHVVDLELTSLATLKRTSGY
jgi:protocatechuate 3,4-dioxygenase beta subunit